MVWPTVSKVIVEATGRPVAALQGADGKLSSVELRGHVSVACHVSARSFHFCHTPRNTRMFDALADSAPVTFLCHNDGRCHLTREGDLVWLDEEA